MKRATFLYKQMINNSPTYIWMIWDADGNVDKVALNSSNFTQVPRKYKNGKKYNINPIAHKPKGILSDWSIKLNGWVHRPVIR